MCVVMASENTPIPVEHIRAGWKENPWGAGVAWIETDANGDLQVRFEKGITNVEDLVKLVGTLTPPYVVHMRIPTEGLDDIELTHPFIVDDQASSIYDGATKGTLLFHNGKWEDWRKESFNHAAQLQVKLPENGLLNDSRMMAWHAHYFGETVLQIIDQKALVFGLNPDGKTVRFQLYGPKKDDKNPHGWSFKGDFDEKANTATGVHYSNEKWEKHLEKPKPVYTTPHQTVSRLKDIKQIAGHGGDRNPDKSFQSSGQLGVGGSGLCGRKPEQEQVEGRPEAPQAGTPKTRRLIEDDTLRRRFAAVHNDDPDKLRRALVINPANLTRRVIGYLAEQKDLVH